MSGYSSAGLLECLEARMLLSAGSWAGQWYFSGFSSDATRYDSGATFEGGTIARTVTIGDLPGQDCLLAISGDSNDFTLTNNGDSLSGHFTRQHNGSSEDQYFYVQLVSPGVAVLMEADAGFNSAGGSLNWSSGVAGLLTRSKPPALARPWEGTYDVQTWEFEAHSDQSAGSLTTRTEASTVTKLSATTFQSVTEGSSDAAVLTASGNTLAYKYTETQDSGDVFEGRVLVVRAPGDWLLVVEGGVQYSANHADIRYVSQSVSISRPQASSEYKSDLEATVGAVPGGGLLIPGETVKVPVTIYNNGNAPATGSLRIDLYASGGDQLDRSIDLLLGTLTRSLKLTPGASLTFYVSVPVPADAPAGLMRLVADIDPLNAFAELNNDNNQASSDPGAISWEFGTISGRTKPAKLVLKDADGSLATFSIKGKGTGEVTLTEGRWNLNLIGTDASSTVSVKVKGGDGRIELGNVTLGTAKSFSGSSVVLAGDWLATGTVGSITLGDVASGHSMTILGSGVPLAFTARSVADLKLQSAGPIKSLKVIAWRRSGLESGIAAPALGQLKVSGDRKTFVPGDFQADLMLDGLAGTLATLGSVTVAGELGPGIWDVAGSAGKLSAGSIDDAWAANFTGAIKSLTVKGDAGGRLSAGSVGSLKAGSLTAAEILAGADLGSDAALGGSDAAADVFAPGWIGKISISGSVAGSTILAGIHPFDGQYNDINDFALGGPASFIKSISIGGSLDAASRIDAGLLPAAATIARAKVPTDLDTRFGQNKFALVDAGVTDANGDVTLSIAGQPQTFEFLDEATLAPIAGAGVAVAVDAQSLSFGVLTIISPGRKVPVQVVALEGSAPAASPQLLRAAAALADPPDDKLPVFLSDAATKATTGVITDKLVQQTFYDVAEAQRDTISSKVGALASGFTSLLSIGIHGLDNVSHGAVSDYLASLPIATNEMMTPQQAKDHVTQARKDDLKSTLLLVGMQRKLDPLAPYSLAIDLGADYVSWGVADMAQNLPGMGVRVTNILGMEIYSFQPIPPWERNEAAGLVNVQVPTAADAQNGFLELISKSDLGNGYVVPLDSQGNADVPVQLGDYVGVVHAAGFETKQLPITVTQAGVQLDVTLEAPAVPGFAVSPTSGLTTGENGSSDSFTVALKMQPTANVTVNLSSSDSSEGSVWPASLTFTPSNWDTPQTVTVTGMDDLASDGDIQYSIDFSSAISSDPGYSGLTPSSVSVTNSDNDVAATVHITSSQVTNLDSYQYMITVSGTASGPVGSHIRVRANMFSTGDWSLTSDWTLADSFNNEAIRQDGDPEDMSFTCSFTFGADAPYTYDGADVWLTLNSYLIGSDSTGPLLCA